ncbi:MAG: hypothetical protein JNM43_16385 [Planctomycetaceae bacterium]|nr:hypothetical protein [Planctomycetaceae bacterium]
MKSLRILTVGALTSSLVVASGCAGKGLKGMFSRNETAGYSTLQELEAKEAASSKEAVADSSGPRFAPWLPLGKKSTADNAVASAEGSEGASAESSEKKSIFRNPFRKQETIEPDPFLNGQSEQSVADSKDSSRTPGATGTKPGASTRTASLSKDVDAAEQGTKSATEGLEISAKKPASRSTTPAGANAAKAAKTEPSTGESDEELVARFEKHFQKNTMEAAEDADALIVVGKDTAKSAKQTATKAAKPNTDAADRKLAELEDLLKSRNTKETDRVSRAVAEESDSANETIRQLSGRGSDQVAKQTTKTRRAASSAEASANREFDRLFNAASQRMTEETPEQAEAGDVDVADATELFGSSRNAVRRSTSKPVRSVSAKRTVDEEVKEITDENQDAPVVTPSQSSDAESKGFRWQSQNLRSRGQQFLKDTVNQSAQSLAGTARDNGLGNFLPPAPAPDVPEPTGSFQDSQPLMIPADATAASVAATSTQVATPAGLTDDSFFTASTATPAQSVTETGFSESAPVAPTEEAVAAPAAASKGLFSKVTLRSWILLIGGAVVVALLYLPGRKSQTPATTAQA